MVYSGFWAAEDEGTPDNMNAGLLQRDAFANRPAAGKEGVAFIATDGIAGATAEEALYRDNGSSWDLEGTLPPTGGVARIATGTYTGDGTTSQAVTGVGFQPKMLWITRRETTDTTAIGAKGQLWTSDVIVDDQATGNAISMDGVNVRTETNAIISLDADGFTVDDAGGDAHPNKNAIVYNYCAIG